MKDIKTFHHGDNPIAIDSEGAPVIQFRPVELHVNNNGSTTNEPIFAIIGIKPPVTGKALMQVSLRMLNEAMQELGYEIIPKRKYMVMLMYRREPTDSMEKEAKLFDTPEEAAECMENFEKREENDGYWFKRASLIGAVPADFNPWLV